jgi:putative transposase
VKRANTFAVRPLSNGDERLLRDLLDASAALWNEVTYERLMRYDDEDGLEDEGVWDAPTGQLEGRYKSILGASTAQQVVRTNSEAWRSFFDLKEKYHDDTNSSITEHPEPPGFRGNSEDGREFKTVIRNTSYTVEWGDRSRLEILAGTELKDRYDHTGRLRLEIVGKPNWPDYETQGRLNLWYDDVAGTFRASQPVTVSDDARATPLASEEAALDIGANNLVACTTSTGQQYLYESRELFQRFRDTTRHVAKLQSKLKDGRYTSRRIRRLLRRRTRRRDHAQEALCRDLVERLHEAGVATVYVGNLTGVLETHWSVETNAKTHQFWAFRKFIERLACTAEEYGISVAVRSEAWTSQECPQCGGTDRTTRHQDTLTCPCGFEGHADLTASRTFLRRHTEQAVRPMARPVRFQWDDHTWSELLHSPERASPNEQRTNRSTAIGGGNVASGES